MQRVFTLVVAAFLMAGQSPALVATTVLLTLSGPALAQETQPGDACAAGEAGFFRRAAMTDPADGGNMMICDGANWQGFISFSSAGNLGIWNAAPTSALDVSGTGRMDALNFNGVTGLAAPTPFTLADDSILESHLEAVNAPTDEYCLTYEATNGDFEWQDCSGGMSDRRLKTDVASLPAGQLEKLQQLQGVSFRMKDDEAQAVEFGFIAQDVKPVYPSLVYERNDGMMSLNYTGLMAPMVEAIKEQQRLIEAQQTQINSLAARIEVLEGVHAE